MTPEHQQAEREAAAFEAAYRRRFSVPQTHALSFPDVQRAREWWQAALEWKAGERADVVPLTGEQVSAEFDALSERVQWNALSAVNAAWHAFKCAIKFSEREHGIAASQEVKP